MRALLTKIGQEHMLLPMKQVNLYEAKTHLSRLVDAAARGESFVISKSGTPVAKLVPLGSGPADLTLIGAMAGEIGFAPDFDAPLPEDILSAFESGEDAGGPEREW